MNDRLHGPWHNVHPAACVGFARTDVGAITSTPPSEGTLDSPSLADSPAEGPTMHDGLTHRTLFHWD